MPDSEENKEESEDKGNIISLIKDYISTTIELARLSLIERVTVVLSNLISGAFLAVSIMLAFLFGSVALGFYLGEVLESNAAGFGIVALIYFVLALTVYLTKDKYIEKQLIDFMVKRIFNKKDGSGKETDDGENI